MNDPTAITHLTRAQAARRLGVSVHTLANWASLGKGPRFLPGRPALYPVEEIEAHLARRAVQLASADDPLGVYR